MTERERRMRYIVHHLIAHPLLVVWPEGGAWLHDVSEPRDRPTLRADEIQQGDVVVVDGRERHVTNVWGLGSEVRLTFHDGDWQPFACDQPVLIQARKAAR